MALDSGVSGRSGGLARSLLRSRPCFRPWSTGIPRDVRAHGPHFDSDEMERFG